MGDIVTSCLTCGRFDLTLLSDFKCPECSKFTRPAADAETLTEVLQRLTNGAT